MVVDYTDRKGGKAKSRGLGSSKRSSGAASRKVRKSPEEIVSSKIGQDENILYMNVENVDSRNIVTLIFPVVFLIFTLFFTSQMCLEIFGTINPVDFDFDKFKADYFLSFVIIILFLFVSIKLLIRNISRLSGGDKITVITNNRILLLWNDSIDQAIKGEYVNHVEAVYVSGEDGDYGSLVYSKIYVRKRRAPVLKVLRGLSNLSQAEQALQALHDDYVGVREKMGRI